jgi:carboxymethylenebutenolidase
MGAWVELVAADGHRLHAYRAAPPGPRRGGLVVVQEIFGVNAHIRAVADGFAKEGFEVLAPALFDRVAPGVSLGYGAAEVAEGRRLRGLLGWDAPLLDLAAAVRALGARPGIVGFCWGGSLAFLAAARLPVGAAVAYYGGQIVEHLAETPRAPLLVQLGERDPLIPPADVERIRAALEGSAPRAELVMHPAGHGFACDARADFEPACAAAARARTLAHLEAHLGA